MTIAPNIDRRIDRTDACWLWRGATDQDGYGLGKVAGRMVRVHRHVWTALVGPIPEGLLLDHQCRVRSCCRPTHLRVVTPRQNSIENSIGPTAANAAKTECHLGHPLDGRQHGGRKCMTCQREATRRHRERFRLAYLT